jgi:hypothetical protein
MADEAWAFCGAALIHASPIGKSTMGLISPHGERSKVADTIGGQWRLSSLACPPLLIVPHLKYRFDKYVYNVHINAYEDYLKH